MNTEHDSLSFGFTVFPAIDLHLGQVVRLTQGDIHRQTVYESDPARVTELWCQQGAQWLHVVNLDGAFSCQSSENIRALPTILAIAQRHGTQIQFGGGIRTIDNARSLLDMGITRIVVGTQAAEDPDFVANLLTLFGPDRVVAGLDARHGEVQTHGWTHNSGLDAVSIALRLKSLGLVWLVYTDIVRDGMQTGLSIKKTRALQQSTNLSVIASGGVSSVQDVVEAKQQNLAGVIIGRALYEKRFDLSTVLAAIQPESQD
jgi:phosphoribosylformimino-5-aminoimidazole carboxamide ribotide isomerase